MKKLSDSPKENCAQVGHKVHMLLFLIASQLSGCLAGGPIYYKNRYAHDSALELPLCLIGDGLDSHPNTTRKVLGRAERILNQCGIVLDVSDAVRGECIEVLLINGFGATPNGEETLGDAYLNSRRVRLYMESVHRNLPLGSSKVLAHEIAHTAGLEHYGGRAENLMDITSSSGTLDNGQCEIIRRKAARLSHNRGMVASTPYFRQ